MYKIIDCRRLVMDYTFPAFILHIFVNVWFLLISEHFLLCSIIISCIFVFVKEVIVTWNQPNVNTNNVWNLFCFLLHSFVHSLWVRSKSLALKTGFPRSLLLPTRNPFLYQTGIRKKVRKVWNGILFPVRQCTLRWTLRWFWTIRQRPHMVSRCGFTMRSHSRIHYALSFSMPRVKYPIGLRTGCNRLDGVLAGLASRACVAIRRIRQEPLIV